MNYRIRRRRFGQILLASTAAVAAVFAKPAKKTQAQEADVAQQVKGPSQVYGVSVDSNGNVVLQSLDLKNGKIKDISDRAKGLKLDANERLTGFTLLTDGNTLIWSTAPTTSVSVEKPTKHSRFGLALVSPPTQTASPLTQTASPLTPPALSGLDQSSTVESLLAAKDGSLLSIVSLKQGTPPFRLANLDPQTGQVSFIDDFNQISSDALPPPGTFVLPPQRRHSNLAQNSDGTIYATSLGREGYTSLIQIDLQQRQLFSLARLTLNNRPLLNDLASLAFSPGGQLYALGDPTYQGTNSLFTIDPNTGAMTFVIAFAVNKITFNRP